MKTQNMMVVLAVAMATWALLPTVSAQADIQSRTFTDPVSAQLDFNEGAGIFDSTVPSTGPGDQTCLAVIQSADVGLGLLALLYPNGRVVVEGVAGLGNIVPNTSIPGGDVTECAGFSSFQGDVGTDDVDNENIGGYINAAPIASNTVFPGSEGLSLGVCPTGDGVTTVILAAPDFVAGCTAPMGALVPGNWDESYYAADFVPAGQYGGIVDVCITADVFDPMALAFVTVSDADYFALVGQRDLNEDVADLLTATLPGRVLNTLTQHTPDVWSAINANGPGVSCGLDSDGDEAKSVADKAACYEACVEKFNSAMNAANNELAACVEEALRESGEDMQDATVVAVGGAVLVVLSGGSLAPIVLTWAATMAFIIDDVPDEISDCRSDFLDANLAALQEQNRCLDECDDC